ncbi:adenylosuccinate synthetase [Roseovarius mucosus]|uniref:adenylosuccinate synthetase n=2 Tax=Rhodobacterales TaxID=204455 RepID=UPI001C5DAA3E|nr:adenylosuccinate synthetase [Roseovarius mucosus]MBW4976326.1 adenylosuccinate synthetase [Roseovarius mucosus]
MKHIIVTSGPIGVGKSLFSAEIEKRPKVKRVSTRKHILEAMKCENERGALQRAGDKLDVESDGKWVADAVENAINNDSSVEIFLVDSARIESQVTELRNRFGGAVFHIHLTAADEELERRYKLRKQELKEYLTYQEAASHGTERGVKDLASVADLCLNTDHVDAESLATAALAWRGFSSKPYDPEQLVDVIVGGQYGSEGKGNVCAAIATDYAALVRIGGPNAGHKVAVPEYTFVQLPSGTGSTPDAEIMIGAGSTISLPKLLKEILDQKLDGERLSIDPRAMIINDWDREIEQKGLQKISTTGQGVGAASSRKILNRDNETFGPAVRLAGEVSELKEYVRNVRLRIEKILERGGRILIEGTQGTMLSIHHGLYPHVTSRETSVAGCLSEAGIAPARLNRAIMVVRTYPIRVGGTSGWIGQEIEFEELSNRSGIPIDELRKTETGSVSYKQRRVAEFDWGQLRHSVILNGATEIAITFADYFGIENRAATTYSELNDGAQDFVQKVERVAGVPVTLISKAFAIDSVIKRVTV